MPSIFFSENCRKYELASRNERGCNFMYRGGIS
jgi:hypothetical protein